MLNGAISPEIIENLVQNGLIDVIKRCSMDGCRDIGYAMGPYAPAYLVGAAVLAVAATAGTVGFLARRNTNNISAPTAEAKHGISFMDGLSPIQMVESFNSMIGISKP